MSDKLGVIHGRFQGLHLGHMEYLLAGASRCEHLIIGLTNYDPALEKPATIQELNRVRSRSNPFTFYERMAMLRDSLIEAGLTQNRFDVVPFPIEFPAHIRNFTPPEAVYYMTIYDAWGRQKKQILEDLGLTVEVMWVRDDSQRLTSGTEVRDLIAMGQPWQHLVPPAARRLIEENCLDQRLRDTLAGAYSNPTSFGSPSPYQF